MLIIEVALIFLWIKVGFAEELLRWGDNKCRSKPFSHAFLSISCLFSLIICMSKSCILWIMSQWVIVFKCQFSYIMARKSTFSMRWWWGPLYSRPTRWVDFYSARPLHQQSAGRHVVPLGHIIVFPSQPVCSFSLMLCA